METIIITAPQGAGKGLRSRALAETFKSTQVVEEWDGVSELPQGSLVFTNITNVVVPSGAVLMTLAEAQAQLS